MFAKNEHSFSCFKFQISKNKLQSAHYPIPFGICYLSFGISKTLILITIKSLT